MLPFVVEQPRLLEDLTGSAERASIIRQDNVIMLGLDPDRAFGGAAPVLDCEWVRGSVAQAIAGLRAGHGCVVPEHFLRETGLTVGDSFAVVPPEDPLHPARYRIAASVRLPGWHWQTKDTGMRPRTHRAAALVFADRASVLADFALHGDSHLWLRGDVEDARKIAAAARAWLAEESASEVGARGPQLVTVGAGSAVAPNDGPRVHLGDECAAARGPGDRQPRSGQLDPGVGPGAAVGDGGVACQSGSHVAPSCDWCSPSRC